MSWMEEYELHGMTERCNFADILSTRSIAKWDWSGAIVRRKEFFDYYIAAFSGIHDKAVPLSKDIPMRGLSFVR